MGLMHGALEVMPGYTEYSSVAEAITQPTIWQGTVRRGDVTAIGSGYLTSYDSYSRAIHQLETIGADTAGEGVATATFTQFTQT
jgi:hypothetical protein